MFDSLFDSLSVLGRTLFVGTLAYTILIFLLRISGKRTLSKWNAFDFIVTVAFGSILGTMLLSKDTTLAQGLAGFALLVVLQFIVSWLNVHDQEVRGLIKNQPTLLLYQGQFQRDTLKHERITEGEVRAAIRANGIAAIEEVEAVVFETDGSFSVIKKFKDTPATALKDVQGYPSATAGVHQNH